MSPSDTLVSSSHNGFSDLTGRDVVTRSEKPHHINMGFRNSSNPNFLTPPQQHSAGSDSRPDVTIIDVLSAGSSGRVSSNQPSTASSNSDMVSRLTNIASPSPLQSNLAWLQQLVSKSSSKLNSNPNSKIVRRRSPPNKTSESPQLMSDLFIDINPSPVSLMKPQYDEASNLPVTSSPILAPQSSIALSSLSSTSTTASSIPPIFSAISDAVRALDQADHAQVRAYLFGSRGNKVTANSVASINVENAPNNMSVQKTQKALEYSDVSMVLDEGVHVVTAAERLQRYLSAVT